MHIIGIDPGLTGALVVLPEGRFFDTPVAQLKAKSAKRTYLVAEMVSLLQSYSYCWGSDGSDTHVYIEAVHSMPGQGVASTFNFGRGYGLWEGIVAALGIPCTLVRPERWKRAMMAGMSGKEKDASRVRAMQLYPQLAGELTLKKHHGRADALLIAAYGQRQQGGE